MKKLTFIKTFNLISRIYIQLRKLQICSLSFFRISNAIKFSEWV